MNNQRVLLVNAPNPISAYTFTDNGNYSLFPALNIISLGTRLINDYPNIEIKVLDGGILNTKRIIEEIDKYKPGIISLSVLTLTYKEGLKIAKYAKERYDCTNIMGNDHASIFPELILNNRSFIDYIIKAEVGEFLLSSLIGKLIGAKTELPSSKGDDGIFSRNGNKIERTYCKKSLLSNTYKTARDIPNLNLISEYIHIYQENYNKRYNTQNKRPITINTARGCINWRKRCLYCSIFDLKPMRTTPEFFWQTVEKYHKEYNINFFFEVADEFFTFKKFIQNLIATKPFDMKQKGIEMEIYIRADQVTPNNIRQMKDLNITTINMGIDSGDNKILLSIRKNYKKGNNSVKVNYDAIKLLAENKIKIHLSFPIGCIGETRNSIRNTINFIRHIVDQFGDQIIAIESSELVPLPDSPAWRIMIGKEDTEFKIDPDTIKILQQKYENKDLLNITGLSKDWIKYFTKISWKDVLATKKEVEKIAIENNAIYGTSI